MNVLVLLAAILLILMVWIGGKKGARSFISLFLNFGVIFLTIFFMMDPSGNPIIITFIASTVICCINLFFINEVNDKTKNAFWASMITIVIMLLFITVLTEKMMIQGFGEEEIDELTIFSLHIGIDFIKMGASVVIMSTIGAITDVAISITSPMREVLNHHPKIRRKELFASGLNIGKDILGSNTNTLFFAFIGGYLALLLWFKDLSYSIGDIINSKAFSSEMLIIFCAGIGIALVIPIASGINAFSLVRARDANEDNEL